MPQYDYDSGINNAITSIPKSFSTSEVWIIISLLLAIIGGIFLYTTYFNRENEDKYTGIKRYLYDFINFKLTIIEPIFRVLYLIVAISITLSSFSYITTNFFYFIGMLVFGNIIARISFEILLLILKLFKDVSEINSKLTKKSNTKQKKEEKETIIIEEEKQI